MNKFEENDVIKFKGTGLEPTPYQLMDMTVGGLYRVKEDAEGSHYILDDNEVAACILDAEGEYDYTDFFALHSDIYSMTDEEYMLLDEGVHVRYLGGDPREYGNMTVGAVYEIEGINILNSTPYIIDGFGKRWHIGYGARNVYNFMIVDIDESDIIKEDAVEHPSHYNAGKYETIDVIEHITEGYEDPFVAYCLGNVVKYIDRAPFKHDSPEQCMRKAAWYLDKAIVKLSEDNGKED